MLEVSVSKDGLDSEWDNFLETRPDGCYQQSSLWAKVKASGGWKQLRLLVKENGEIVGGAQVLLRSLRSFGSVGYVSKGPVFASNDPEIQEFFLNQLDRVAKAEHILFLKIQPPYSEEDLAERLLKRGALLSETAVVSQATARVDICSEPDAILDHMPRKKRQDIRRAERRGVTVREGTEADMATFHYLVKAHGDRQNYHPYAQNFRHNVWSIFGPGDHSCLLLAEYQEQTLAAMIVISFGDVVFALFIGDSGCHKDLNAHSVLHWKAMLWGKERNCAWYDFGGISVATATAIIKNEPIPDTRSGRLDRFKMSFGSQVLLRPGACDISYVWPSRLTGRMVPAVMKMQPLLRSLLGGSLHGEYA